MKKVHELMLLSDNHIRSNSCGYFSVVKYNGCFDVVVQFKDTGYRCKTNSSNIVKGAVFDPYSRTVFGEGFMGSGPHRAHLMNPTRKNPTYTAWVMMMTRCYNNDSENNPSYRNTKVCDRWLNFQNFAEWYENNHIHGYHLDKDILCYGENYKLYSPSTCLFIPQYLNSSLSFHLSGKDKAVSYSKSTDQYRYKVHFRNPNTGEDVNSISKFFDTSKDARLDYWIEKTTRLKKYVSSINDHEVFLDQWVVEKILDVLDRHLNRMIEQIEDE